MNNTYEQELIANERIIRSAVYESVGAAWPLLQMRLGLLKDDVLQEARIVALKALMTPAHTAKPSTIIYAAVRNMVRSLLKKCDRKIASASESNCDDENPCYTARPRPRRVEPVEMIATAQYDTSPGYIFEENEILDAIESLVGQNPKLALSYQECVGEVPQGTVRSSLNCSLATHKRFRTSLRRTVEAKRS